MVEHCEELSQRALARQLVQDIARDAVQNSDLWVDEARDDRSGWKLTVNKRNMQVFRARLPSTTKKVNPSLYTFLTVGYLPTSLNDLRTALLATTSVEDQIMQSYLLDKDYVTSHVVQNYTDDNDSDDGLPSDTPVDFFGIKYLQFTLPGTKLGVYARDTLYLEYLIVLPDNHGIDTLVKVVYSIDNSIPSPDPNCFRATIMDTMLFRPAQNGKIHVIVKSYHDMKGSVPKYLGDQSSLSFWRIYKRIATLGLVRNLLSATHLRPSGSIAQSHPMTRASYRRLIADSAKKQCVVCAKKISLFSNKLLCHLCGLCMCSKCFLRINYSVQESPSAISFADMHKTIMIAHTEDFCRLCVRANGPVTDDPNQIASVAPTTPVDVASWPFSESTATSAKSSVAPPSEGSDSMYFGMQIKHHPSIIRRSSTATTKDERDYRLSKEEQPPLVLLTPSQMSALEEPVESTDVFEEMRKSIAIQENLISAMRASWHGSTEGTEYPRRMSRMDTTQDRFARDNDRFEELD
ncbi:hypothetical protein THRCLA_11170 [Thraustotheca clavata]|uniref:FYVE-type domain-containing protein n=1 Tax=Thraustotheca clavata TaxID=74557 RepID=A0A1V9Y8P7_9STRA|nr:hypothetical protein THRCLA_11170 [Thraustotheca clavata]